MFKSARHRMAKKPTNSIRDVTLRGSIGLLALPLIPGNQRNVIAYIDDLLNEEVAFKAITSVDAEIPPEIAHVRTFQVEVPLFNPWNLGYALRATALFIEQEQPDLIVNVSNPFPLGLAMLLVARFKGVRTIVRITGDPFAEREIHSNWLVRLRKILVHEIGFIAVLRGANRILCVGPNIAQKLLDRGILKSKIRVLPQPFRAKDFVPGEAIAVQATLKRYGLDPSKRRVLFCGSLTYGKGADRLIRISEALEKESGRYQICVVGDGPLRRDLEVRAGPGLVVLGRLSRTEVLEIFGAVDVLLHPTRSDGLPTVILEAIASGIPVIATPVGEIPHYVSETVETELAMVKKLLDWELVPETRPDWFDWEVQRQSYRAALLEWSDGVVTLPSGGRPI